MHKSVLAFIVTVALGFSSKAHSQMPAAATPAQTAPSAAQSAQPVPAGTPQNSQHSQAPDSKSNATAEDLARKYIELWNTGDKTAISAFPDFLMHNHGGRVRVGSTMLERVISTWRKSMPDLTFNIDDVVAQGDKVAVRVTLKGTYKELLFPEANDPQSPPRMIRATGLFMFRTGDGKIQEVWQELDENAMRIQMGAQWKTRAEISSGASADKSDKQQLPADNPAPQN